MSYTDWYKFDSNLSIHILYKSVKSVMNLNYVDELY